MKKCNLINFKKHKNLKDLCENYNENILNFTKECKLELIETKILNYLVIIIR